MNRNCAPSNKFISYVVLLINVVSKCNRNIYVKYSYMRTFSSRIVQTGDRFTSDFGCLWR
jgi:hypothetical protein